MRDLGIKPAVEVFDLAILTNTADLLAGRMDMMFDSVTSAGPRVTAGRLAALAVTTSQRIAAMPELPTMAEGGVPGFAVDPWFAMLAPRAPPASAPHCRRCCRGCWPIPQWPSAWRGSAPSRWRVMRRPSLSCWRRRRRGGAPSCGGLIPARVIRRVAATTTRAAPSSRNAFSLTRSELLRHQSRAGESAPVASPARAPKEQPPRKLSGPRTAPKLEL